MPELRRFSPSRAVEIASCRATKELVGHGLELWDVLGDQGAVEYCRLPSPSRRAAGEPGVAQYCSALSAQLAVKLSRAGELLLEGEALDVRPATAQTAQKLKPEGGKEAEEKEPKQDGSFWLQERRLRHEEPWWYLPPKWQEWAREWTAARRWQREHNREKREGLNQGSSVEPGAAAKEREGLNQESSVEPGDAAKKREGLNQESSVESGAAAKKREGLNPEGSVEPEAAAKAAWREVEEKLKRFSEEHSLDEACRSWLRDRPRAVLLQVMQEDWPELPSGKSASAVAVKRASSVIGELWDRGEHQLLEDFIQRQALDEAVASRLRDLPSASQINILRANLGDGEPGSKGAAVAEYLASAEQAAGKRTQSAAAQEGRDKRQAATSSRTRPPSPRSADAQRHGGQREAQPAVRLETPETPPGDQAAKDAAALPAPKRYIGRITNINEQFCFVRCVDTYKLYERDVFLSFKRNPKVSGLCAGAQVAFCCSEPKRPFASPEATDACEHKMGTRNALIPARLLPVVGSKAPAATPVVAAGAAAKPAAAAKSAERRAKKRQRSPSASSSASKARVRAGKGGRKRARPAASHSATSVASSGSDSSSSLSGSEERRRAVAARAAANAAGQVAGRGPRQAGGAKEEAAPAAQPPPTAPTPPGGDSESEATGTVLASPSVAEGARRQPGSPVRGGNQGCHGSSPMSMCSASPHRGNNEREGKKEREEASIGPFAPESIVGAAQPSSAAPADVEAAAQPSLAAAASAPAPASSPSPSQASTAGSSVLEVRGLPERLLKQKNPGKALSPLLQHVESHIKKWPFLKREERMSAGSGPLVLSTTTRLEAGAVRMRLRSESICAATVQMLSGMAVPWLGVKKLEVAAVPE